MSVIDPGAALATTSESQCVLPEATLQGTRGPLVIGQKTGFAWLGAVLRHLLEATSAFLVKKYLYSPLNTAVFHLRAALHNPGRQARLSKDRLWIEELHTTGGFVTHLDQLELPITAAFREAADQAMADLPNLVEHPELIQSGLDRLNGRSIGLHCYTVDGPELARRFMPLVQFGLEERLLDILEDYFGMPVAFTSLNLRKDIGGGAQVGTRYWHLDTEDVKVIRLMVYLKDVSLTDGPFEYIARSITESVPSLRKRALRSKGDPIFDDEMRQHVPEKQWLPVTGRAGTVLLADNALCYHHGKVHDSERIVLIYTYTSRHPRYPLLVRNDALDAVLNERQRASMFLASS